VKTITLSESKKVGQDLSCWWEVADILFISGQLRTREILSRDSKDRITEFTQRREGSDLLWKKVN